MTRPVVTFWFEFASTYSYLSTMRVEAVAADRGVDVIWQPFLLGPIFGVQGWTTSPFNIYPAKGRNMWRDMERECARLGLPLVQPDPFPQNTLLAARVAVRAMTTGNGPAFCKAVFEAEFGQGRDVSSPEVLAGALEQAGLSASLLEEAVTPENKQAVRDIGAEAERLGIFGAPRFVTEDGELFWGNDRLEQALDWELTKHEKTF
ncbi:MAG: 2-hydroxychromene-2-carboxylate isomerase [Paracoccaceae bacterium]